MTTVNTSGRFVGDWPRIGIRPAVDGRLHGVRESLEEQTRNMALRTADLIRDEPALPGRHARRGRRPRPQHRRRLRGGQGRRAVPQGGRGRLDHDHALLVLRLRDDGHGPPDAQGGLGLQRHRAPGRGLPRRGPRRAHPEGPAGVRHLRPRRPGRRRRHDPGRRRRRRSCASPGPAWPRRSCAASRTCPWAASRWASPAPSWTSRSSRSTWACASRPSTCPSSPAGWRRGSTTRSSSRRRSPGRRPTAPRAPTATRPTRQKTPRADGRATGRSSSR